MSTTPVERVREFVRAIERKHLAILAGVASLSFLAGAVYSVKLGSELRYWDEREYVDLAMGLVREGRFGQGELLAFRPPLYPAFLALWLQLTESVVLLRLVNFALLSSSTVLLYRLVLGFARPGVALLAAVLVLGYPVLFYAAGTLYPQTLATTLLLACLCLVVNGPPTLRVAAMAGGIFGCLVLTVPTFLPLLGLLGVWLLATRGRRCWPYLTILSSVTIALVLGWSFRNHLVLGHWVLVSTNSGLNLLMGNGVHATPAAGVNVDLGPYLAATEGLDEVARDRFFRAAAVRWITENPWDAIWLYLRKFIHYFATHEQLATASESSRWKNLLMLTTYGPLLAAMALRLALVRRYALTTTEALLYLLYIGNGLVAAVFFTRIRFRLPLDVLAIALAASFIGVVLRHWTERRDARPAAPLPST